MLHVKIVVAYEFGDCVPHIVALRHLDEQRDVVEQNFVTFVVIPREDW